MTDAITTRAPVLFAEHVAIHRIPVYFTLLNFALVLLHQYVSPWINVLYLSWIVFCVGSYLFWIHPRRLCFPKSDGRRDSKRVCFTGTFLRLVDLTFHVLPVVLVFSCHRHQYAGPLKYDGRLALTLFLFGCFILATQHDLEDTYHVSKERMAFLLCLSSALYVAIPIP